MATRDTPGMGGSNWKTSDMDPGHVPPHQSAGQQAGDVGRRALGAVQDRIRTAFDQQTHRAADQLSGVASALNKAAQDISRENDGPVIRYAEQAAGRIDAMADVLRRSSLDDMVDEVEGFARRQPELFLGGVFAAGFVFARFLKSSADRRTIIARTRYAAPPAGPFPSSPSSYADAGPVGTATPATGTTANGGPVMGRPLSAAPSTPPGTGGGRSP